MAYKSALKKTFYFICFGSTVAFLSCKPKQLATQTNTTPIEVLRAKSIIEKHNENKSTFSTVYIKSDASFDNGKQSQNVSAEIKIKKDKQILVSLRFLGITMAKASITPNSVSYYEKLKGTYFEGDFSTLSQWLGTDLNYVKIQNMLLGEALDDLSKGKYIESLVEDVYRLDDKANNNTQKTFYIDPINFKVKKQEVIQTKEARMIQMEYADFKTFTEAILPQIVHIKAIQEKGKTEINLEYKSISFNEELSFPYSVPNGYKRILIN